MQKYQLFESVKMAFRLKGTFPTTMLIKWLAFIILLTVPFGAAAQTINAASCSASDVQAAFRSVTAATTIVNIPAGTCHWSTAQVKLTIPAGSSTLSILGAGSLTTTGGGDQTVIVDDYSNSNPLLLVTTNSTPASFFRLAGITFQGGSTGTGNDKWAGIVMIGGSSQNIRVDHFHGSTATYSPASGSAALEYVGCTSGVTDHSIFDAPVGSVNNAVHQYNGGSCNGDTLGVGDQSWTQPTGLGSANFMFVEDSVFNNGAGNDCTDGGRFVYRHNAFNMTGPPGYPPAVQTHPTGVARLRGCRAYEIYANTFTAQPSNFMFSAVWLSSGTGVVWGNTIPSSSAGGGTGVSNFIYGRVNRSNNNPYVQQPTPTGWGYCGTAFSGSGSCWDQNAVAATGYACIDQIGRGAGDLLVNDFPTVTNNRTGTCTWPNQALEPVYEWANAYSPVPSNPSHIWTQAEAPALINRDYYLGTADSGSPITFTGATGVGAGLLSARPGTCTALVAYWATDTNTLYQCSSTNTWTVYYTPYTYPHPLTQGSGGGGGGAGTNPNRPTNLQAVVH
jgi:hypothetical protein